MDKSHHRLSQYFDCPGAAAISSSGKKKMNGFSVYSFAVGT
jgi:hypothetical protein